MRPLRIEVEGFSAYRDRVEVRFEDVDFFSLTGPTGAGKSSLIDAMVFALYGRVPRLGGNAVAPAITAGADRARVRLDFEVDGQAYTAARMALRTSSGGASVKEARLQRGDEVLADGADQVTAAVEVLLRLRFEDFTRTVVLPQGEFARFLTATKAERQGLLRNLLGLDVYTVVRELAKTREAVASDRAGAAELAISALDVPDEKSATAAKARLTLLEGLAKSIGDEVKKLEELDAVVVALGAEDRRIGHALDRLDAIAVPDDLESHESLVVEARSVVVDTEESLASAKETLQAAEAVLAELPSPEQLKTWLKERSELETLEKRLEDSAVNEAREAAEAATETLQLAEAALDDARAATALARSEHAAHLLADGLVEGETCPVCAQIVTSLPRVSETPAIHDLEKIEEDHVSVVKEARKAEQEALTGVASAESTTAEMESRRAQLLVELEDAPPGDQMDGLQARVESALGAVADARGELTVREAEQKNAADRLADLADMSRRISKQLTAAQLSVADLEPPVSESDDPIVQWKELSIWRDETARSRLAVREELAAQIESAQAAAVARRHELVAELRAAGLEGEEPFAVEVATSLQQARTVVENHEKSAKQALDLAAQIEVARTSQVVAGTLANHLKATGFERWLMVSALTDLVTGANHLLGDLSGGGYSLHSDESGDFSIVDHRNADERRSVATLSGGETFLVSLALALSLAETLSAKGGAGLDAIILDEGFGTLDEESLDTVASVLEELSGSGLMVGIITHVKELAIRAPVRYEVTREIAGSRVKLVP